ncbi:hypothetical protein HUT03_04015 [Candidatus Liberibacter africanus]|uniref:hypothetical protein n=1 Tax=Liberibacter africanus TaxID=34020 RepID=UPI001AE59A31|nr:hypothetical protein [Candidatus Liberibacter africanus]QTP64139.1 hypothetical protein HUT03_03990 [Candidatus Liberibacter africanus]QTP64143.1 hypothetical protein HUT03_04015 [Candidatus Liberibacter africanus]
MIKSFIAGGIFRFCLHFIPENSEKIIDLISGYIIRKQLIEQDRVQIELAKVNTSAKIELANLNTSSKIDLEIADIKYDIEALKEGNRIRLEEIKTKSIKNGFKWIGAVNYLVRPITTIFWIIVYPLLVWWSVSEGMFNQSPLAVLTIFEQEIIACILGFWYTDKIVQKKQSK